MPQTSSSKARCQNKHYLNQHILPFITITLLGLIVYGNSLLNGFVLDDFSQLVNNPSLHSIKNLHQFFSGSTFYGGDNQNLSGAYYRPLTTTFLAVIYAAFGQKPFAFHLIQIIFHLVNSYLLYILFRRFFSPLVAFLLALLFLVHPINSEAVFYISNTQEVLFFFFGISAWLISTAAKQSFLRFLAFLSLSLCSLLSKETGVLFVLMSLAYVFSTNKKNFVMLLGSSIVLGGIYLSLRLSAIGILTHPALSPLAVQNTYTRLLNSPMIVWFYLKTFLLPLKLAASYQWVITPENVSAVILSTLFSVLIAVVIFFGAKYVKTNRTKNIRLYVFFCIWLIIGLLFHLQLFPLDATVAERWFYFPIVGILGMLGLVIRHILPKTENKWPLAIAVLGLSILAFRTFIRSYDWRDNLTLVSHDLPNSPDSYGMENILALELLNQGQLDRAELHAKRSIDLYPYLTNYNTLGTIYLVRGQFVQANQAFLEALKFGDRYTVYENLCLLALLTKGKGGSVEVIKLAIKKYPKHYKFWLYLAIWQYQDGEIDEAKRAINRAMQLHQDQEVQHFAKKIMNGEPINLGIK